MASQVGPNKVCPRCGEDKPRVEGFGVSPSAPLGNSYCKDCRRLWNREHPAPSHLKQKYHLQRVYGITSDDYRLYWEKQEGRCSLCDVEHPLDGKGVRRLHVDHDHRTGRIRGLLCHVCNKGLGYVERVGVDSLSGYLNAR